jgi:hypothetical protein
METPSIIAKRWAAQESRSTADFFGDQQIAPLDESREKNKLATYDRCNAIREADDFAVNALHKQQNDLAPLAAGRFARYLRAAGKFPAGAGERTATEPVPGA